MWSKKYDKCVVCGTTERKHEGKGMCINCHHFKWRKTEKGKEAIKKMNNSDSHKESFDRWYKSEKGKETTKKYNHSDKHKKCKKKWLKENPGKMKEYVKQWREKNPEKFKKQRSDYWKKKSKNNIHFKIKNAFSSLIRKRLKSRLSSKKGKSTFSFLLYTIDDLIRHLEKLFTERMTWENYGEWHIDHIKPDCSFNYKSVEDEEFQKCWALSNLQPLWAEDNMKKNCRY